MTDPPKSPLAVVRDAGLCGIRPPRQLQHAQTARYAADADGREPQAIRGSGWTRPSTGRTTAKGYERGQGVSAGIRSPAADRLGATVFGWVWARPVQSAR